MDPNIQRSTLFQGGQGWTSVPEKKYGTVYIHLQECHLWTCLGNKQINQRLLELRSKHTTSWESDSHSALNSRKCNYGANPSKVLRVWEDERVNKRLLLSFIYSTPRYPPEQRLSHEHERGELHWKPSVSCVSCCDLNLVIHHRLGYYSTSALIFKHSFFSPLLCSYSHFDTSLLRWHGGPHWFP